MFLDEREKGTGPFFREGAMSCSTGVASKKGPVPFSKLVMHTRREQKRGESPGGEIEPRFPNRSAFYCKSLNARVTLLARRRFAGAMITFKLL